MSKEQSTKFMPGVVAQIPVERIERNPHNPRRLFDREPLNVLKESIGKVGVLVPITVYPKVETETNPATDRFVLLDGERRWRCVRELHVKLIPAIVVERPDEVRNILTMFAIHNLREDWQLMPTALKLRVLMDKLQETNERKLKSLTRLSLPQIRRCKILLSYPRVFQNRMLAPPTERLKPDFFIELQRIRAPALDKRFDPWIKRGDIKCVNIILDKYLDEKIKAVTDFRILAEVYRGSVRVGKVGLFYKELERFLADKDYRIEDIHVPGATFEKEYKEVVRSARRLTKQVKELPSEAISANKQVVLVLRRLSKIIQNKLEKGLVEELAYVKSE
jgi:ParB/RepB/Spo0J family partition protein